MSFPAPVSHTIEGAWHMFRDGVKDAMWPGQMFETLGIKYFGPIDGHDLPGLINTLAEIKHVQAPVLLHVKTVKGNGYEIALQRADQVSQPRRVPGGGLPGRDQQEHGQIVDDGFRRRHDRPGQQRSAAWSP